MYLLYIYNFIEKQKLHLLSILW